MSSKIVYICECRGEGIVVVYDKEDDEFMFSFWEACAKYRSNKLGWRDRLRWIWHLMKTGCPYLDMVILKKDIAREMAKDILSY